MKSVTIIILVLLSLVVAVNLRADPIGSLARNAEVLTPTSEINSPSVTVKDGFPVFEIRVPDGYTEVQVRASITNFEPGFLLLAAGVPVLNYIPTGTSVVDGATTRKSYRALGTTKQAVWNATLDRWEFNHNGVTSASVATDPWLILPEDISAGTGGGPYTVVKEVFCYRTCTTGIAAEPTTWGTGASDPDPRVFFATQSATPGAGLEFKRQSWNKATALTSQLNALWSPGYTVTFQPSRSVLGASEWMQQNMDKLVWLYQVESVGIKPQQPNGTDIWNVMHPAEWRKNRIELFTPAP